jgi:hypothetical protein
MGTAAANAAPGDLTFKSCFSDDTSSFCTDPGGGGITPTEGTIAVAVSPNSGAVYSIASGDFLNPPTIPSVSHYFRGADGALTFDGCLANDAGIGCVDVPNTPFDSPNDVAVSPNNLGVYVTSENNDAVSHLIAQPGGQISWGNCVANTNVDGCSVANSGGAVNPLDGATQMAIRPNGTMMYVVASDSDDLARVEIKPDGSLVYQACYSSTGGNGCVDVAGNSLGGLEDVAISPDGNSLYTIARSSDAITHFRIRPDGILEVQGCIGDGSGTGCAVNPPQMPLEDPKALAVNAGSIYVVGNNLVHLNRAATGEMTYESCIGDVADNCANAPGFGTDIALSPDGANVYTGTGLGGALRQYLLSSQGNPTYQKCYSRGGSNGACQDVSNPILTRGVVVSPDSGSLYAADAFVGSLSRFSRELPPTPVPDPPADPTNPTDPPGPVPGEPTALALNITGKDQQRVDRLKVRATCTVDCEVIVQAHGKAGGQKFTSRVARQDLAANTVSVIKPRIKRKIRKQIEGERGRVTLTADATATTGETAEDKLKAKLKP